MKGTVSYFERPTSLCIEMPTKQISTVSVVPADDMVGKDEALLASLGYKQELRREFSPIEIFGIGFSIIGLFPSIAYVQFLSTLYY